MADTVSTQRKNWVVILGALILSVGLMIANYGCAVSMASDLGAINAAQYYVLVSALGSLAMMLVLPIVGQLTGIFGMRNLIAIGIIVQCAGRILMMFSGSWIPYAAGYFIQGLGGGCYTTAAYVIMAGAVSPRETPKFFGFISVAISIGSMLGPVLVSTMSAAGGITAKLAYISHLPFAVIGYLMILKGCPNQRVPDAGKGFDYPGLVLSVIGLSGLVLWLNLGNKMFTWVSAPSIVLVVVAVVSLAIVIRREIKIKNPAIPLRMFKNKRLTYAFIGVMSNTVYSTCVASYTIMWVMYNYGSFPGATLFNGTASIMNHIMGLILGLFLGTYIGKKFIKRFRSFAILGSLAAIVATGMLFCLRYTGTAAEGNIAVIGNMPVGMILIYVACAIGGFSFTVANATYTPFWQSNTPREQIPSGQAMYSFGGMLSSCFFGALVGLVMGNSGDYSIAFGTACILCVIGLIFAIIGFKFTPEEIAAARSRDAQ